MNPTATMYIEYFSTLTNVASMIISIIAVFLAGYVVYLRQQRDKYREKINSELQHLDTLIFRWSILEESPLDWRPPISKYIEILSKESWGKTPLKALEPYVKKVEELYEKARKEEYKIRQISQGKLVAGSALYLEVKFALNELLNAIYREFPVPPGDYVTVHGIPINFKSFVKADFPRKREEFLKWAEKFERFFEAVYRIYMYRLRGLIKHLKEVYEESVTYTLQSIKEIEKQGFPYTMRKALEEYAEITRYEPEFYEKFFEHLLRMVHTIERIKNMIVKYDGYAYKRIKQTIASFIAMIITGVLIPFAALLGMPPQTVIAQLSVATGVMFAISAFAAIIIIYKEVMGS